MGDYDQIPNILRDFIWSKIRFTKRFLKGFQKYKGGSRSFELFLKRNRFLCVMASPNNNNIVCRAALATLGMLRNKQKIARQEYTFEAGIVLFN